VSDKPASFIRPEHGSMITTLEALAGLSFIPGLDETEVRTRRERGEGNDYRLSTSRPLRDILSQNVFTLINIVLFTLASIMVALGRIDEALLSVSLIVMNITVGITQEIRAKRKLDRIALLTRPKVSVMREGQERQIDPAELVRGDVIVVRPGDQIMVDGILIGDGVIQVNESLLTGESDQVTKRKGDSVLSGSFCVSGQALYVARRVGARSFANRLSEEARTFRVIKTPLQRDVNLVIRVLMMVAFFFGTMLVIAAVISDIPLMRSVQFVTVVFGLVPNGLFFMVIVAYALGALRITTQGALIQQANSVESLSHVDTLCMDKTGTLTENRIEFVEAVPLDGTQDELMSALGDFAASATVTNATTTAIRASVEGKARQVISEVPFDSARKWSALAFATPSRRGVYALGAYEMLAPYLPADDGLSGQIAALAGRGLRVLVFAHNPQPADLLNGTDEPSLPPLLPLGLVALREVLRPDARRTLEGFQRAGVRLKIISGDDPLTVLALARQTGLSGDLHAVSGPELAAMDESRFAETVEQATVFGRITPPQKEQIVATLRAHGHYVAMIGDGVNDVLSLKKANLAVAMQGGTSATRAVADMVLLNDSFSALPPALEEGRRITSGMRDILRLYVARAVSIILIIIAAALVQVSFPYIPKHISLVAWLTIGLPTFALAVWARPETESPRLLTSVLHFALPAGILMAIFGLLVYVIAFASLVNGHRTIQIMEVDVETFQVYAGIDYAIYTEDEFLFEVATLFAQTVLTAYSLAVGLLLLLFVEPPTKWFVGGDRFSGDKRPAWLAIVLALSFLVVMAVPRFRQFWELLPLEPIDYALVIAASLAWVFSVRYAWRARLFERYLGLSDVISFEEEWQLKEEENR